MASTNAYNAYDSISANKNCDNCCADPKAKVACPLCWDALLQKCKTKKPKNKTTKKPEPLGKNKHSYVHRLLDSAPEGDENDDYIGDFSATNVIDKPESTDGRPLPAYKLARTMLREYDSKELKKSVKTDIEKNEKKIQ